MGIISISFEQEDIADIRTITLTDKSSDETQTYNYSEETGVDGLLEFIKEKLTINTQGRPKQYNLRVTGINNKKTDVDFTVYTPAQ